MSDFDRAKAEWERIGGFRATSEQLLNFLNNQAVNVVEYATWTPIELDDQIARAIQNVLINHRGIVMSVIDWIRSGYEPSVSELEVMVRMADDGSSGEYGSPMTTLYIIAILYKMLQYLKSLGTETRPIPPMPEVEPSPVKRPVMKFIRTFLRRSQKLGVGS
jgi:hypothetical protein